jgi:hypothetical protein
LGNIGLFHGSPTRSSSGCSVMRTDALTNYTIRPLGIPRAVTYACAVYELAHNNGNVLLLLKFGTIIHIIDSTRYKGYLNK